MTNKFFLLIFAFFLMGNVFALTKTGEYQGSFDVDVGDAGIVISPQPQPECQEDWTCSYWTTCSSKLQQRVCIDCNHCGTYSLLPTNCGITQSCSNGGTGTGGSSGGGGGGGGGNYIYEESSGGSSCVENWQCTGWSSCEDGKQRRACTDSNKCGTFLLKPAESKECEEETLKLNTSPEEQQGFLAGITGAVIGALGTPAGIGVLIFIIAIVGMLIFVVVMRKKEKKKEKGRFK